MKAMLASDFFIAKKYLVSQLILCLFVGVFIAYVMENIYAISPAVGMMVPLSVTFTILALDERENWEQFRLALPLSRTDVIAGRYACLAAIVLIGIICGLAITGLVGAIAALFPQVPQLANLVADFSWQIMVLVCAFSLTLMLVMMACILPAVARFGMTRAVRFTPLVLFVGVMLAVTFSDGILQLQFLTDFLQWVQTPMGTILAASVAIAVSVVLFLASGMLAAKLYQKREL